MNNENSGSVKAATVGDWKRKRNEVEKWMKKRPVAIYKEQLKSVNKKNIKIIISVIHTFKRKRNPISGRMLQAKALDCHKMFSAGEYFTDNSK